MEVKSLVSSTRKFVDSLDEHRQPWESIAHWHARKTFLRNNWDKFEDKDRLICLSSAWANVHFMENKYSPAVMKVVRELEQGMPPIQQLLSEQ